MTEKLSGLPKMISEAPALQEVIARAIFDKRNGHTRGWDWCKEHDQWLALSTWREAEAVMLVLPLAVRS